MNVLIVDNSAPDRSIPRYIFLAHGWESIEAENGRESLIKAKEHRPDLIVSEALMPVMDGFAFLRAIKADPALRAIPFIFYSAVYTVCNEEALARSLGAEAFLVKPLKPQVLWQEVQALPSQCMAENVDSSPSDQSEEEQ